MARTHLADPRDRPGVIVPDDGMDHYSTHVAMRNEGCINMWMRVAKIAQGMGRKPTRDLFSDKAEAQTGRGLRNADYGTYDAAHIMNTTFRPDRLTPNWQKDDHLQRIYAYTSGTTMQFPSSNRGPDKVIDGVQTRIKNELFDALTATTRIDVRFIETWLRRYLVELLAALEPGSSAGGAGVRERSYQAAYNVTATQLAKAGMLAGRLYDDVDKSVRGV